MQHLFVATHKDLALIVQNFFESRDIESSGVGAVVILERHMGGLSCQHAVRYVAHDQVLLDQRVDSRCALRLTTKQSAQNSADLHWTEFALVDRVGLGFVQHESQSFFMLFGAGFEDHSIHLETVRRRLLDMYLISLAEHVDLRCKHDAVDVPTWTYSGSKSSLRRVDLWT